MTIQEVDLWVAVLGILLSGLTMAIVLAARRSFGSLTERIERAADGVRQSNELTRQSNARAIDEFRAGTTITTQAHEKYLEAFADAMRWRKELKDMIDTQRSA